VEEQIQMVKEFATDQGGTQFRFASSMEERNKIWQARHDGYYAVKALKPNGQGLATDVCVPISRLAECVSETAKDLENSSVIGAIVGHVGDGNFHIGFIFDPENPKEAAEIEGINERMVQRALAMDGTCTGEHGIGYGKMDFLIAEHGEAVSVMRLIKKALDPDNIMNPGKIVRV
jgi:D-lactate dehydrogenase (cytochrome)